MFIECYRVPVNDWGKPDEQIRKPENKILITLARIDYIQSAPHDTKRSEILLSTDKGSIMRCAVKEIRIAGRNTQGVRIKKLSGNFFKKS